MVTIGVVDTMFARVDMGTVVEDQLASLPGHGTRFTVLRRTVPGFKDLAVECKLLIERHGCAVVVACGMVGGADIDQVCAHEASQGIMMAQLLTNTHILEVFVHEREAEVETELVQLCRERAAKHAINAYWTVFAAEELRRRAGQGVRQGAPDAGPIL